MENVCRLCANTKTPRQLTSSIEDLSLNIEQKLIDCCRWKLYDTYETYSLPRRICSACLKNLERSWAFAESVAKAQQELLAQMVDTKPTVLLEIESVDTANTENIQHVTVEEIKVSVSPHDTFGYDHDYGEAITPEDYEDLMPEDTKPDLKKLQANDVKKKDRVDINLLKLLSENDKNADGTIRKEKILELDLNDWSMIMWRCCTCQEIFENHRQLKTHFERNHTTQTLRLLCTFCKTSFGKRRSVLRHILTHRPYLKFWFVFMMYLH